MTGNENTEAFEEMIHKLKMNQLEQEAGQPNIIDDHMMAGIISDMNAGEEYDYDYYFSDDESLNTRYNYRYEVRIF